MYMYTMYVNCTIMYMYSTARAEPKCESLDTRESSALDSRGLEREREYSSPRACGRELLLDTLEYSYAMQLRYAQGGVAVIRVT